MLEETASQNIDFERIVRMLDKGETPTLKFGIDPTSPDLHLGHLVPLMAFKQLLGMGCKGTIIIGEMTASIGDPSGRDTGRPVLSHENIQRNAESIKRQVRQVLGDGDWGFKANSLDTTSLASVIELMRNVSVGSMLGRDHFRNRHDCGDPISLCEMICPVLQALDSIELKCDIEIGGNDQLANCTLARDLMGKKGLVKQAVLLFPILIGVGGTKKMGKSLGNHISFAHSPRDVFGRTMRIPDSLVPQWLSLLFHETSRESSPFDEKKRLALKVTELLCGHNSAVQESAYFDRVFCSKNHAPSPTNTTVINDGESLVRTMKKAGVSESYSEARRLIVGGGVRLDCVKIEDPTTRIHADCVLTVGKRRSSKVSVIPDCEGS